MKTITLKELEKQYTGTYSVKADTVRGRIEKSFYDLVPGDEVLIDNHFTLIVEEEKQEGENMEDKILETIKAMDDSDIIALWNEYCDTCNYPDSRIESMDFFDDIFSGSDPLEIASRVFYGNDENREGSSFNPNREYFYFNGYGNPVSLDYIYNNYSGEFYGPVDIDSIVSYIVENNESLYNDDIQEILYSFEEIEEE